MSSNQKKARAKVIFAQTFKDELMLVLLKLFHKMQTEGTLPNSFSEMIVTLITKPHKDSMKRIIDQFYL